MSKLKVFSICTGVSGLDRPFHKSKNFDVIGFAEIDKYCIQVLNKHFPDIKNYGDISEFKKSKLPDFDILVGGTPCQSFSEAGNRTGFKGKSGLFLEFVEILKTKKPKYFLHENVRGMFHSTQGWDFAKVQIELAKAGYSFRWEVLTAKDYGVPQSRERVFTVGFLRGRGSRKVFCETGSSREDDTESKGNSKDIEKVGNLYNDPKGHNSQTGRVYSSEGISPTLKTPTGGGSTPLVCVRRDNILKKRDIANNIDANYARGMDNHGQRTLVAYSKSHRSDHIDHRIRTNDTANTFNTGDGCRSQSSATFILEEDVRIRKLTPTECERLMSWPSGWTRYGLDTKGKKIEMSDTQRYKMIGNGVVSNCVKPIRDLIIKNENRYRRAKKKKR